MPLRCLQYHRQSIWEWCIACNVWISAAHIPGKMNVQADMKYRNINLGAEWMLNPEDLKTSLAQLQFHACNIPFCLQDQ